MCNWLIYICILGWNHTQFMNNTRKWLKVQQFYKINFLGFYELHKSLVRLVSQQLEYLN